MGSAARYKCTDQGLRDGVLRGMRPVTVLYNQTFAICSFSYMRDMAECDELPVQGRITRLTPVLL